MNKLLVICGPTATGKTETAIKLAKKLSGEIISADSRQVYRGMDIATGKDLSVYGDVPVWMLDVVEPTQSFSVAQYHATAVRMIREVWERKRLPIVVGGTGLYIKAVVDGIETIDVPPNAPLRKSFENKSAEELFEVLNKLNPDLAASLNLSDKKNKRRLIRKIELVVSSKRNDDISIYHHPPIPDVLFIGLTAPAEFLKQRINDRIDQWIKDGAEKEVRKLIDSGISWDSQAMNAIGYSQWRLYFEKEVDLGHVVSEWKKNEWQYAKRQLTWFRKDERIVWFNIESSGWAKNTGRVWLNVEKKVSEWYNKTRH